MSEARRVLKLGGHLLAVGIIRYAGLLCGNTRWLVFDSHFVRIDEIEVQTGLRRNLPETLFTFPQAFFHQSDELAAKYGRQGCSSNISWESVDQPDRCPTWRTPDEIRRGRGDPGSGLLDRKRASGYPKPVNNRQKGNVK